MSDCQSCGHCLGGTFCYFPQEDVHGNHAAQWRTGGCPACAERNAIVSWLRTNDVVELGGAFADYIESGAHLGGDDE